MRNVLCLKRRFNLAHRPHLVQRAGEPIIACSLLRSTAHCRDGCDTLRARCVTGITANREHLRRTVENSIGIVTALNPCIGYANATRLRGCGLNPGVAGVSLP